MILNTPDFGASLLLQRIFQPLYPAPSCPAVVEIPYLMFPCRLPTISDTTKMGLTTLHLSPSRFADLGRELAQSSPGLSPISERRRFRALFGVTPILCSRLWDLLAGVRPHSARPIHLLWGLLFLKVYGSEHTHRTIAHADEKTFRKWAWCFVHLLADIDVVSALHACSRHTPTLSNFSLPTYVLLFLAHRVERSNGIIACVAIAARSVRCRSTVPTSLSTNRRRSVPSGIHTSLKDLVCVTKLPSASPRDILCGPMGLFRAARFPT